MNPPEIPLRRILAYHPKVLTDHKGEQYKLSASVPDYMTDEAFVQLVLEHVPGLDHLTGEDLAIAQHLESHSLWDLKVERLC